MIHRFSAAAAGLSLVALVACATTSQILPIKPTLELGTLPSRGAGKTLSLRVVDERPDKVVGYRDPNDKGTAITPAPEMLKNITRALEAAYAELGFELLAPGAAADVALEVTLVELDYRMQKDGVIRNLSTGATVKATSVMPSKTVKGTYRDAQSKETVVTPSLHKNADILNAHLDAALLKLVSDDRLTSEDW